jgi:hypothetical protein
MLIVTAALVLTWLAVFLPMIGLLVAEGRRCTGERGEIAAAEAALEGIR